MLRVPGRYLEGLLQLGLITEDDDFFRSDGPKDTGSGEDGGSQRGAEGLARDEQDEDMGEWTDDEDIAGAGDQESGGSGMGVDEGNRVVEEGGNSVGEKAEAMEEVPAVEMEFDWNSIPPELRHIPAAFFKARGIEDENEQLRRMRLFANEIKTEESADELLRLHHENYAAVDEMRDFLRVRPEYQASLGNQSLPAGREVRISRTAQETGGKTELPLRGVEAVLEETRNRVAERGGFAAESRNIVFEGEGAQWPPMDSVEAGRNELEGHQIPTEEFNGVRYRIFSSDRHIPMGLFQSHDRPEPDTIFTVLLPIINDEASGVVWMSPIVKLPVLWRIILQLEAFFRRGGLFWLHVGVNEMRGGGYQRFQQLKGSVEKLGGRLEITLGSDSQSSGTNNAKGVIVQVARTGAILFAGLTANITQGGLGSDIAVHQHPRYWRATVSNEMMSLSTSLFCVLDGRKVGSAWSFLRDISKTLAAEWLSGRVFLPLECLFKLREDDKADSKTMTLSHALLIARLLARRHDESEERDRTWHIVCSLHTARNLDMAAHVPADQPVCRSAFQATLLGSAVPKPVLQKSRSAKKAAKAEAAIFERLMRNQPGIADALESIAERNTKLSDDPQEARLRDTTRRIRLEAEASERARAMAQEEGQRTGGDDGSGRNGE